MSQPVLFERYPQLRSIPWVQLARSPTPVQSTRLSGTQVWIKRDDLTSSLYGGNKVRKLEFLLAQARQSNVQRLITAGAFGSHHGLATVVFGRQMEFDTTLVLFPQPVTSHVRAVLLTDAAFGAELRFAARMTMVPTAVMGARIAHWRERTRLIPYGGSDAVGSLGYVNATLELGQQIEQGDLPSPDTVVVAAGTLGTSAGIAVGLTLLDLDTHILATRITSKLVSNERALHALIRRTCAVLERHGLTVNAEKACQRVALSHAQVGPGYGQPTEAAQEATSTLSRVGLELDITYTAKAAADLLHSLSQHPDRRHLFWHTLSATMPAVHLPSTDTLPDRFRPYLGN